MTARDVSRWVLALFFVVAGVNHFVHPATYLAIMPPYLPYPSAANLVSGAAEIAGGLGVLVPGLRRAAGWGLILLLVAVFPANIQMALHGLKGASIPAWILWARLPFQLVFIAWVVFACLGRRKRDA